MLRPLPELLAEGRFVVVDGRRIEIVRRAGTAERPIVRLAGCSARVDAEALRGLALEVPREELPPLEEDEYWAHELEGCRVVDGGAQIGVVLAMRALPSCEVLEVERGEEVLLVPLVRDAVRSVDVRARVIDVDLRFLGASEVAGHPPPAGRPEDVR